MNQEEKQRVHTQASPVQPGKAEAPGTGFGDETAAPAGAWVIWTAAPNGVDSGGAARGP